MRRSTQLAIVTGIALLAALYTRLSADPQTPDGAGSADDQEV